MEPMFKPNKIRMSGEKKKKKKKKQGAPVVALTALGRWSVEHVASTEAVNLPAAVQIQANQVGCRPRKVVVCQVPARGETQQ